MKERVESKLKAKESIKGHVWGLFLIVFLVGFVTSIPGTVSGLVTKYTDAKWAEYLLWLIEVAVFVFAIPVWVAVSAKFLHFAREEDETGFGLFSFYREKCYWEVIKAKLLVLVYVTVGMILFIIPGIIMALRYSVLDYVFADDPKMSYRQAMDKCKELTAGRKGEIFVFYLSFIGWYLLVPFTAGLILIYLIPYANTAFANYYNMIIPYKDENNYEEPQQEQNGGNFDDELFH